jgi:hypothetical protein
MLAAVTHCVPAGDMLHSLLQVTPWEAGAYQLKRKHNAEGLSLASCKPMLGSGVERVTLNIQGSTAALVLSMGL